jgi:hemoglobin
MTTTPTAPSTLFDRIGGQSGVGTVVAAFYGRVTADPLLAGWFDGVDMVRLVAHQRRFLAAALGGPDAYEGRDLSAAHRRLGITDEAFDRVAGHLATVLTDLAVPDDDVATIIGTVAGLRSVVVALPVSPEVARTVG